MIVKIEVAGRRVVETATVTVAEVGQTIIPDPEEIHEAAQEETHEAVQAVVNLGSIVTIVHQRVLEEAVDVAGTIKAVLVTLTTETGFEILL